MIVYLVRNRLNNKRYVGITKGTLQSRWAGHVADALEGSRLLFHRAIRKYGPSRFELSVLEEHSNVRELKRAEVRLIAELKTYARAHPRLGYNMTKGGDGTLGLRWNAASKKRASEKRKGWKPSPETIEAMRASHIGKKASPETREKQSRVKRGKKDSEATRAKKSAYSKNRTPEHRTKLSASLKGGKRSPEQREKISRKLKGRKLPQEHKDAIRAGMKKPGMHEKLGRANKRENMSSERLQKLSERSSKPVQAFSVSGSLLATFSSIDVAAREMGVTGSAVSHAAKGLTKTCRGYVWKFAVSEEKGSDTDGVA